MAPQAVTIEEERETGRTVHDQTTYTVWVVALSLPMLTGGQEQGGPVTLTRKFDTHLCFIDGSNNGISSVFSKSAG